MTADECQAAILRHIRTHGPSSRGDLYLNMAEQPSDGQIGRAMRSLKDAGQIHVSGYRPPRGGSRGQPSRLYGVVGVHPPAVSTEDRIVGTVRAAGQATPNDIAEVVGMTRDTIMEHCKRLERAGRLRRVGVETRAGGGKPRVLFGVVG